MVSFCDEHDENSARSALGELEAVGNNPSARLMVLKRWAKNLREWQNCRGAMKVEAAGAQYGGSAKLANELAVRILRRMD
jgi:hypothetical protein